MDSAIETYRSKWKRIRTSRHGLAVLLAAVVFAYAVVPAYSSLISLAGTVVACLYCLTLGGTKVDLRALGALCLLALATSFSVVLYYGDISRNNALFYVMPALYFALSYLGKSSQRLFWKLCVVGAAVVACAGLTTFSFEALQDTAWRARAVLGSPNALGIFLAIAWLCLMSMRERDRATLVFLEPVLLACLALTLSGGSLLSLACGFGVVVYRKKKTCSWRQLGNFCVNIFARMAISFFLGIMFYIAANRTTIPWFCFVLVALVLLVCVMWPKILLLLEECQWLSYLITVLCGLFFVAALFMFRQSAFSTFAERVWMMENGIGYLFRYPLYGLGYGQWPIYNFQDDDMYFNVSQIHNTPIHIGVEFGLIAMAAVMYAIIHRFWKGGGNTPGALAFAVHSMIDNPIFSRMGLFGFLLCAEPRKNGTRLDRLETRVGLLMYAPVLLYCLMRLLSWYL